MAFAVTICFPQVGKVDSSDMVPLPNAFNYLGCCTFIMLTVLEMMIIIGLEKETVTIQIYYQQSYCNKRWQASLCCLG